MILDSEERIREFTDKGWWGTETIVEKLYTRAVSIPDREALIDPYNKKNLVDLEPTRMTYGQMIQAIDRIALKFIELGIQKDDVIIVQLPNIVELTLTIFAASRAGAIVSPIPVQWRAHEIIHAVDLTGAKIFVSSHNLLGVNHIDLARKSIGENRPLKHYITVSSGKSPGALQMSDILSADAGDAAVLTGCQPGANDVFTLCWTSGTEAIPKAVPRSHNHWIAISRGAVQSFLPDQECVYLSLFPTINMAGLGAVLIPWVLTGGKMVFHHPFDLVVFLQQLAQEKIYYTLAPPALLDALAKSPQWATMDKGDLKVIGSGSAPLSTWMVKTYQDDFGIGIVNFFASNEGVGLYSSPSDFPNPEDRASYFPRFGGKGLEWTAESVKGFRSRLVDPATEKEIVDAGIVGELRFAGPTVFPGYYKAPELTEKAFDREGYFRSGDLFSIEGEKKDKYLFQGRYKDLIIRGGVNISPEEIETLVIAHPKVAEVAAVGYPDHRLGEKICIAVVPKVGETVTLEEINTFLSGKDIAKYKYPEVLKIMTALPRNPLGKVLKREIRESLQAKA
ncbi:MAG: acyl--CoA ligase [Syntrophales bacterium]|nr:acyl--CoA ligase [Syntrophales bacterium]